MIEELTGPMLRPSRVMTMRILASATAAVAVGLAGAACSPSPPARVMQPQAARAQPRLAARAGPSGPTHPDRHISCPCGDRQSWQLHGCHGAQVGLGAGDGRAGGQAERAKGSVQRGVRTTAGERSSPRGWPARPISAPP